MDLGPLDGLLAGAPSNVKGYWERRAILEVNDAVLHAMGGWYDDPPALEPGWHECVSLAVLKRRAARVMSDTFGGSELWGFKDPRTCLTLPFWRDVLPPMRYVICVRHPAEVAASFARSRSESAAPQRWETLWLRSLANALIETGESPRTLIFYDDYFSALGAQLERLAQFIGRPLTREVTTAAELFVERQLRHHWHVSNAHRSRNVPRSDALELYDALCSTSLGRAEKQARKLLKRHRRGRISEVVTMSAWARGSNTGPPQRSFGIYGDGWLEREAYVALPSGPRSKLLMRLDVLPCDEQFLDVLLNGDRVVGCAPPAGRFSLELVLPPSKTPRHLELRWARTAALAAPDERQAAALLCSLHIEPAADERRGSLHRRGAQDPAVELAGRA
jgi:hypothetical protein